MRSVEELKEDIQKAKDIEEHIRALSWKYGEGGHISKNIVNIIYGYEQVYNDSFGVDKDKLLGIIDGYFCLPYDDRLVYRIGRRIGMFRELDELSDEKMYNRVKNMIDQYGTSDRDCMNKDLLKIMHRYIQ
jgi:hypothetical protein